MRDSVRKAVSKQEVIDAERMRARHRGCLCVPEVKLEECRPQVFRTELRHAECCPLYPAPKGDA